jgi:hypothetical protein
MKKVGLTRARNLLKRLPVYTRYLVRNGESGRFLQ